MNGGQTKELTRELFAQIGGTTLFYPHPSQHFLYTEGVRCLLEKGSTQWLLDAIASYQPSLQQDSYLCHCQRWQLTVAPDCSTTLMCAKGFIKAAVIEKIVHTDFPLSEFELYLVDNILQLPAEYGCL